MGPRCSSAKTQVCHRSYIIAASEPCTLVEKSGRLYIISTILQVNISMLTRYILQLVGSLGFMFYLNAALTGVLLAVVPFVSIMAVQYGKILVSE